MLLIYILMWPVISAIILYIIVRAFFKDLKRAKDSNETIV